MPGAQALAGVVHPARVPTTSRWLVPAPSLLVEGGEFRRSRVSLCLDAGLRRNDGAGFLGDLCVSAVISWI